MHRTMERMRKRAAEDRGFTMIELLVVVVIIGVLVAIAVPVYLNYRKGAANKSAASDVRSAITAVEQYYTDNANTYPPSATSGEGARLTLGGAGTVQQTITVSPGNVVQYTNNGADYSICARNTTGGKVYVYRSASGGAVKESRATALANCPDAGD